MEPKQHGDSSEVARRSFLARAGLLGMGGGLALSYGSCGAMAVRYLYPARPRERRWQFLACEKEVAPGAALSYRAPSGEHVTVARRGNTGGVEDFVALSSTCPHLGCHVHWEPANQRFFCPCHNGAFDPEGRAIAGPPAEAGQSLARYPLRIEDGVVFIEVPMDRLA